MTSNRPTWQSFLLIVVMLITAVLMACAHQDEADITDPGTKDPFDPPVGHIEINIEVPLINCFLTDLLGQMEH